MRLLHVSDIHCATRILSRILASESYDLVAATGDFECLDSAETLLEGPGRVLAVTGNLDNPSISRRLREAGVLIDGSTAVVDGVSFAGVGGLDPAGSISRLMSLEARAEVLLSHHPPRGVLDLTFLGVHAGLDELNTLAGRLGARLHLFGHIHESPGYTMVDGRVSVNPGPVLEGRYALIDYPGGRVYLRRIRV